jgi:hypothetical protein
MKTITLDKPRELKFNFAAFVKLDEVHGINAMDPATYRNFTPKQAVAMVWAAQLHTPQALNLEAVASHMPTDTDEFVAMMNVVVSALSEALGATPDDKK